MHNLLVFVCLVALLGTAVDADARTRRQRTKKRVQQTTSPSKTVVSGTATRTDLKRLRSSIEATRKRIDELQRRESTTVRSLSTVQRQRKEVAAEVRALEGELHALQDSVAAVVHQLRSTMTERQRTESAFADVAFASIAFDAAHVQSTQLHAPHALSGPGDAFLMKHATGQVRAHRRRMLSRQDSLSSEQHALTNTSSEQQQLLRARSAEDKKLATTINSRKQELERIRGDKSLLLKELASKRSSANTLSAMIQRQEELSLAKEAQRQKELARATADRKSQRSSTKVAGADRKLGNRSDDFSQGASAPRAGGAVGGFPANSLPWPTQSRALIHGYGTYRNRETGTTLDNPGLDIRSPIGARMTCVAPGTVSSVTWLPGFGSLVIVDHRNGFRTVYANLASTNVSVGSSVQTGSVIGTSGESIDGPTAHFEVWRGRERQNPLTYLR